MSTQQIARRYAQALADVTEPQGEHLRALEELRELCGLFEESAALRGVFISPAVTRAQKEGLLQAILERIRSSMPTRNFLRVLLRNERLAHLPDIAGAYAEELDRRQGVAFIEVRAARALSEEERRQLERRFEALTRRKVRMSYVEDQGLIGGVVAQWGSEVFDGSVRTQLDNLRLELSR